MIDADEVVHALQRRGQPVFEAIVSRFGESVVGPDGELDRSALAALVFDDPVARSALEAIVHPAVGVEMGRLRENAAASGKVVVLDIPLLAEAGADAKKRWALDGVIVVDCSIEVAVKRLVGLRGMSEDDARARVGAQVSREERLAVADFVIRNSKGLKHLEREVERCWEWIEGLQVRP